MMPDEIGQVRLGRNGRHEIAVLVLILGELGGLEFEAILMRKQERPQEAVAG